MNVAESADKASDDLIGLSHGPWFLGPSGSNGTSPAVEDAMTILEDDEDTELLLLLEDALADVTPPPKRPARGSLGASPRGGSCSPVVETDVAVAVAEVAPPVDLSLAPGGTQLAWWFGPARP